MAPNDLVALMFTIMLPTLLLLYVIRRWFSYKEKQLEANSRMAAERAAEYATSNSELEQRIRVLEQIVTDGGAQTAAQIEALRSAPPPRIRRQVEQQAD
jgi:hypothetical protein